METWVIIASGESLTEADVERVRMGKVAGVVQGVIAVSNVGIDKAPWADALVSHDAKWWGAYGKAFQFAGRKFCRTQLRGTEQFLPSVLTGCNSGLMAMEVAYRVFGAERIVLLGFDMHGSHYFGKHPDGLVNTTDAKWRRHISQFDGWRGCPVVNCTQGSALNCFPKAELSAII